MGPPNRPSQRLAHTKMFSVAALLVLVLITTTESLLCYQCGTSGTNGDTRGCYSDLQGMINTSLGLSTKYYKNCTKDNPKWDRCMIETSEFAGAIVVYHRGCHDGKTFQDDVLTNDRFKDLKTNNYSTCDSIGNNIFCYRFCDTDFCNGPQKPNNTKSECEKFEEDPYNYILPLNVTCGAFGIHTDHGPITFQMLVFGLTTPFFVSSLVLH